MSIYMAPELRANVHRGRPLATEIESESCLARNWALFDTN